MQEESSWAHGPAQEHAGIAPHCRPLSSHDCRRECPAEPLTQLPMLQGSCSSSGNSSCNTTRGSPSANRSLPDKMTELDPHLPIRRCLEGDNLRTGWVREARGRLWAGPVAPGSGRHDQGRGCLAHCRRLQVLGLVGSLRSEARSPPPGHARYPGGDDRGRQDSQGEGGQDALRVPAAGRLLAHFSACLFSQSCFATMRCVRKFLAFGSMILATSSISSALAAAPGTCVDPWSR